MTPAPELPCDRCGTVTWLTLVRHELLCGPCAGKPYPGQPDEPPETL
jgi:hypothetical protein